ncbi:MAG: activating signal cointegrator 1 complex subunit, partial [Paramarteilia canceri]
QICDQIGLDSSTLDLKAESTKVFLVLQGQLNNVAWPIYDYETDLKLIMDQTARILQAMLEIASDLSLFDTIQQIVHLLQSCTQWCFPNESMLKNMKNFSNSSFMDLNINDLLKAIHNKAEEIYIPVEVKKYVRNFPYFTYDVELTDGFQILTLDSDKTKPKFESQSDVLLMTVKIDLKSRVRTVYAPKVKKDSKIELVIIVGNLNDNSLLHYSRISAKKTQNIKIYLDFKRDRQSFSNLRMLVMHQSFIGMDFVRDFDVEII